MNNCNHRYIWHRYGDIACQYFCNHGNHILKTFLPISAQKCADFSIGMTRYDVLDIFSFDLKPLP